MGDYWSENLRLASIHGIEVDLRSRQIVGGHAFGRHQYQGLPGQDTEPTGAAPLALSLVIELDASVNETHYPITYQALVSVLRDNDLGGQIDYIDPLFGPIPMQVVSWSSVEESPRRNAAVVTLSLEERSTETSDLTVPISAPRGGAAANATARRVDVALPSAGVLDEDVSTAFLASGYPLSGAEIEFPIGGVFSGITASTIARFERTLATVDFVRAEIDRFHARCAAVEALAQIQDPERVDLRIELMRLVDFVSQAGHEVLARRGLESTYQPIGAVRTASAVAERIYGDPRRWLDVVASNGSVRNPLRLTTVRGPLRVFVPRGAVLVSP